MDTSGTGFASILLYLVVLALFVQIAIRVLPRPLAERRFPWTALGLTLIIGIPSLLQFAWPGIGAALSRHPDATIHHGEWWRVLTAVLAQDGGLVAAIFNLIVVALVTCMSEWIWGSWRTITVFLGTSIVVNLLALTWNAPGGGSSFASDGLLMGIAGFGFLVSANIIVRACAIASTVIAIILVAMGDAHGLAMLIGVAAGVVLGGVRKAIRRHASPK